MTDRVTTLTADQLDDVDSVRRAFGSVAASLLDTAVSIRVEVVTGTGNRVTATRHDDGDGLAPAVITIEDATP